MNTSQQRVLAAKANRLLGCVRKSGASRSRDMMLAL